MVSVIVPIYNAEKYLVECLESIAKQTYTDLEVILVNDGSTDSSKHICEEYCFKYKHFKLINKENGGQMTAWIEGIKIAKGDFFGFVDSDDKIDSFFFEKMVRKQKEYNADLVMCSRKIVELDGSLSAVTQPFNLKEFYDSTEVDVVRTMFLPTLVGNLSQSRWDKLFKRELFLHCMEEYCLTPVRTFEDRFIVIPYVFSSTTFAYIDEPLYYWRKVSLSSSRKPRPELCDIADLLFNTHLQMLTDMELHNKFIGNIELEKIDILRNAFERNLCLKAPLKTKNACAKRLLSKANRKIVLKHKKDCVGRFGMFFYWSCKLNSALLLLLGASYFEKQKRKGE